MIYITTLGALGGMEDRLERGTKELPGVEGNVLYLQYIKQMTCNLLFLLMGGDRRTSPEKRIKAGN